MDNSARLSLKDFSIVKDLGSGSFGKVQLVRKKQNNLLYALKSVSLQKLDQKQRQNALNEVRLLASIQIPTVIGYEGAFFDLESQSLCVILEYADGGDLQQKITELQNNGDSQGFEQDFIWQVAYQILQGLRILHKNNIIHRDIKTANIFFSKGVAKLGDLNVSKITDNGLCTTQTGTPFYTSPQIWKGNAYGSKCDVWSSGCIFYEMCTLAHPFKAMNFPQLYRKITAGVYPDIPSKYSDKMKSLIKMCLTNDEDVRPSAEEILQHSIFNHFQRDYSKNHEGVVNIVEEIRCPKVLRFLNSRLPKPKDDMKKTVCFTAKRDFSDFEKQNKFRKIRSQKLINLSFQSQYVKELKQPFKNVIKLPPMQKDENSQKQVTGLTFSGRKLKTKAVSTKFLPQAPSRERRYFLD